MARLRTPRGITRDGDGNLYFADSGNSAIRKVVIDGANFVVTTLAGTMGENGSVDATGSDARFRFPDGLACDADGNIFAIDRYNECVRKITPTGVVTTLAGVPGFQGSDDGAGAAAQFYQPQELALDGDGNIYVVEHANNTVRKIAPVGPNWVVTTLAGCPTCPEGTNDGAGILARFRGPFGLTFSGGNVFVADTGNKTIRKLTPSVAGWEVTTFAGLPTVGGNQDGTGTAARFSAPLGLARDSAGNLYVGDSAWIRRITPVGTVSTLAGQFLNGSADGPGSTATFWSARGVAVDQAGNVFVADQSNQLIRKLTSGGGGWNVTTIGGTPGAAGSADGVGPGARFNQPTGVAVDAAGNVYVADSSGARVTKGVSGEGPVVVQFDVGAGMLVMAGGNLTLRLLTPASGSIVLQESPNLLAWLPIRTNLLTAPTLDLVIPFKPGTNGFFRLIYAP